MLLLRIILTICALYGLYRLADDTPAAEQTAYLPIGVRRLWSILGFVLTLVKAWERRDNRIGLDFTDAEDYRLALNNTTRVLLEPGAVGQTYTVQRKYRVSGGRYHRSTWYNVVAIQGTDGTVYRTWQQSAASIDRARPYGLASMTLLWFMIRKHNPKRRR